MPRRRSTRRSARHPTGNRTTLGLLRLHLLHLRLKLGGVLEIDQFDVEDQHRMGGNLWIGRCFTVTERGWNPETIFRAPVHQLQRFGKSRYDAGYGERCAFGLIEN